MVTGLPGHNRRRQEPLAERPLKPCTNCTGTPCVMFFYGGVRLCLKCAQEYENDTLTIEAIHANHERAVVKKKKCNWCSGEIEPGTEVRGQRETSYHDGCAIIACEVVS